jgi:hypothetical protein
MFLSMVRPNHFCNYLLGLNRHYPPCEVVCLEVRVGNSAFWSRSRSGGDQ